MTRVITRPFARIDGVPVAIGIVDNVIAAKAWFRRETGYDLIVYSGIRTYDEQVEIFTARYTLTPNGRRVYDARWWNGRLWYRISAAGTVAQPGTSNHETGRSLDLRDTGPDAGVASSFTAPRNRLLSANCHRFGLTHTGKNFAEPWHFEALTIADPFMGMGKPQSISPSDPGQSLGTEEEDDMFTDEDRALMKQILAQSKSANQAATWSKEREGGTNGTKTKPADDTIMTYLKRLDQRTSVLYTILVWIKNALGGSNTAGRGYWGVRVMLKAIMQAVGAKVDGKSAAAPVLLQGVDEVITAEVDAADAKS